MFVAYTGYARIATLGEEVREPRRTIPRAIGASVILAMLLYVAVAVVGVGAAGAEGMFAATTSHAAPLAVVARAFLLPVHPLVTIGAITAMLGVLLNLLLGLSRVLLAMGRRGDLPRMLSDLRAAILVAGAAIAALAAIGNVETTWSFSAFTVLVYYAVTNLAALRLPPAERLYRPLWAWIGLVACSFLAFWIDWRIWTAGLALLVLGALVRILMRSSQI
jgi:APA family basic amino acid/polyamine antiporter